jgi:clumping factor A
VRTTARPTVGSRPSPTPTTTPPPTRTRRPTTSSPTPWRQTETDEQTDVEDDFGADAEDDFEADAEDDGFDGDADAETDAGVDEGAGPEDALRQMTVIEALEALPEVDRFAGELAGTLETELDAEGDVTVFVPLDEAFEDEVEADDPATDDAIDDEAGADDTATDAGDDVTAGMDTPIDERVIAYHLHPEAALSAQQLVDDESISTAAEDAGDLRVSADGDVVSVDADESTAQVVCANIETQDGTIHVIDEILLPRETDAETDADTEGDAGTEADGTEPDDGVETEATRGLGTESDAEGDADADAGDDLDGDAEGDLETDAEDDGFDS